MIMDKARYPDNPFGAGGEFNAGWKWTHPYVCQVDSVGDAG
jgi:hypothetical protein